MTCLTKEINLTSNSILWARPPKAHKHNLLDYLQMIPSDEQQKIIHHISMGQNVSVNAVAGSGKSTTVIFTAQRLPQTRFLQITYNSFLRKDVDKRLDDLGIANVKVHTYHSLAVKHYSRAAWTDIDLQHVVSRNSPALATLPLYDVIILDEIQDMTLLYFSFVVKFLRDVCLQKPGHRFQMVIMGDVMQGLYDFKGADTRFLTHASEVWSGFPYFRDPSPFVECTLRISYRITTPIAAFVNRVMLGEELLVADKPGCPVRYVRNQLANLAVRVCHIIRELIRTKGILPEEIFILAGSVRSSSISTTKLENLLVMHGIPCYVPRDQQNNLDDRVIQGKVVFSTFHAVKGRQRPHVFVLEYDNSYFDFLGKAYPSTRCPNTLYVACTRASESLYLFEKSGQTDRPMDFHKMGHYEMKKQDWITFEGTDQSVFWSPKPPKEGKVKTHIVKPTDLIKFMSETVVHWSSAFVERAFRQLHTETNVIDIPTVVQTAGFWEDVSDLNGIAIPPIFFSRMAGGDSQSRLFYDIVGDLLSQKNRRKDHHYLAEIYDTRMPRECRTIADWLFSANIYSAVSDGLYSKLKQLGDAYDWLTEADMQKCADRINSVVFDGKNMAEDLRVEVVIAEPSSEEHAHILGRVLGPDAVRAILGERAPPTRFLFAARVDLIMQDKLWELKCTSELALEHFLQLAIYAWLWQVLYPEEPPKEFRLFNIRTGEHYLLDASLEELTEMIVVLLRGKYGESVQKTNEDFLTDVRGVLQNLNPV